jgi:hypothetical protein
MSNKTNGTRQWDACKLDEIVYKLEKRPIASITPSDTRCRRVTHITAGASRFLRDPLIGLGSAHGRDSSTAKTHAVKYVVLPR